MRRAISYGSIRIVLVVVTLGGFMRVTTAQTLVKQSAEARFQLDRFLTPH
jgi:hypothetical protein